MKRELLKTLFVDSFVLLIIIVLYIFAHIITDGLIRWNIIQQYILESR